MFCCLREKGACTGLIGLLYPEHQWAGSEPFACWRAVIYLQVEGGFRFLKSPDFLVSSLYLKKPERIEALLMVMTLCLMVYAAIQHRIRHELKKQSRVFPNQKKKPCQNPTARWVFFCFQGINVLTVNNQEQHVVGLKEKQWMIIQILGISYESVYSW